MIELFVASGVGDPAHTFLQYGVLGALTVILLYVVKKLYETITSGYEARLADRDKVIADRDRTIADRDRTIEKQDVTISLLLRHGQNTNTALERTAQVMEVLPQALPSDDLAQVRDVLARATTVLESLRAEGEAPK